MTLGEYIQSAKLKPHIANVAVNDYRMWLKNGELDEPVDFCRIETEKTVIARTPSGVVLINTGEVAYIYHSMEEADAAHPTLNLLATAGDRDAKAGL